MTETNGGNPAERLAGLQALEAALKKEIKQLKTQLHNERARSGHKTFDTRFGAVNIQRYKPKLVYDDHSAVQWANRNGHESKVIQVPQAGLHKLIADRFSINPDGTVVDKHTGHVPDWIQVDPGKEYIAARLTDEVKSQAQITVAAVDLQQILRVNLQSDND